MKERKFWNNVKACLTDRVLSLDEVGKCEDFGVETLDSARVEYGIIDEQGCKYQIRVISGANIESRLYDNEGRLMIRQGLFNGVLAEIHYSPAGSLTGRTPRRFKVYDGGLENGRTTNKLRRTFVVYSGDVERVKVVDGR